MELKSVQVKGYKCLVGVDLKLKSLNVVVGPEGSGKTSLIEVFRLLRGGVDGSLEGALSELGGAGLLVSKLEGAPGRIGIFLDFDDGSGSRARYALEFTPEGEGYRLIAESIRSIGRGFLFSTEITRAMGVKEPSILSGSCERVMAREGRLKRPMHSVEKDLLEEKIRVLRGYLSGATFLVSPGAAQLEGLEGGLVLVDDLEPGPDARDEAAGLLRGASVGSQLVVATRSTALAEMFDPSQVVTLGLEEGRTLLL